MHIEATLTQLVFEHTLRTRIGSHTSSSKDPANQAQIFTPSDGTALAITEVSQPSDTATDPGVADHPTNDEPIVASTEESAPANAVEKTADSKTAEKVKDQTGRILTVLTNDMSRLQMGLYFWDPCMPQ
jgi:hypothetical protein